MEINLEINMERYETLKYCLQFCELKNKHLNDPLSRLVLLMTNWPPVELEMP